MFVEGVMTDLRDGKIQRAVENFKSDYSEIRASAIVQLAKLADVGNPRNVDYVTRYPGLLPQCLVYLSGDDKNKKTGTLRLLMTLSSHGGGAAMAECPGLFEVLRALALEGIGQERKDADFIIGKLYVASPQLLVRTVAPSQDNSNIVPLFDYSAQTLLSNDLHWRVFSAFNRACREDGFTEGPEYIFGIADQGHEFGARSYHDREHFYYMALSTGRERSTLSQNMNLDAEELRWVDRQLTKSGVEHDVVYTQVDGGLRANIGKIVSLYGKFSASPYEYRIAQEHLLSPAGRLVVAMFGFKPGQTIGLTASEDKPNGLNEFLSALVAVHCLLNKGELTEQKRKSLIAVSAMIEATNPFRPGATIDALYDRMIDLGLSDREAEIATKGAVLLANRDVDGFCGGPLEKDWTLEQRFKYFVAGTWKLMPENNPALRGQNYMPADFLATLKGTHFFITKILKPDTIFHQFRGFPNHEDMDLINARTRQNLELFDDYMTAKIASASIVTAIAKDLDPQGRFGLRTFVDGINVGSFPDPMPRIFNAKEQIVFNTLLDRGDKPAHNSDIPSSPIAAHLMKSLGMEGVRTIMEDSATLLKGDNPDYEAFLKKTRSTNPEVFDCIVREMKRVIEGRQADYGARHEDARVLLGRYENLSFRLAPAC
jgi:hypothetical protein